MKSKRLLCLFLLCSSPVFATTLSGTITDSEGAVINNAHVVIHWDPSGSIYLKDNLGIKEDITVTTDANGAFKIELPSGFYDVFVSATAFSPYCEKVRIKGPQGQSFKAKLKSQSRYQQGVGLAPGSSGTLTGAASDHLKMLLDLSF